MALFSKDPQQILKESEDFIKQNTAITSTGPGSKMQAILQIMKRHLSDAYTTFDYNTVIPFIHGANGRYLDYLGDIFGVKRIQASTAYANKEHKVIRFYTNKSKFSDIESNMTIPRGTKVWANKDGRNIEYVLTEDLSLPNSSNEAFASVRAVLPGAGGNIQPSTLVNHNYSNKEIFVENISSIETGSDPETDENLRYRIINQKLVGSAANETALRIAALKVPGVADVEIFDRHFGIGTTAVMVKSTTPVASKSLIARVQSEIDKVKGSGLKVIAISPDYLEMRFTVSIQYKSSASEQDKKSARENVKLAISDYVNNLDIGSSFSVNRLASIVLGVHPMIKSIGKSNKFFDKIYVKKNVIEVEVVSDYSPSQYQKLIMSTETNNVVFN